MLRITSPTACFGIEIAQGRVIRAAPIAKYTLYWPVVRVVQQYTRLGYKVEQVNHGI